jgi:hypothetical protein
VRGEGEIIKKKENERERNRERERGGKGFLIVIQAIPFHQNHRGLSKQDP